MRNGLFFLLLVLTGETLPAQFNPLQTQYTTNPFVINPACAGEQGYMSATASYRRQWTGFAGAPETFAFTIDSPVRNRHHNIGVLVAQDNIAVIHNTVVRFGYAYRITGKRFSLAAGVQPGITFRRCAWNEIQTNNPDEVFAQGEHFMQYEIGYGLYFNTAHAFAGVSSQVVVDPARSVNTDQPFMVLAGVRAGSKEKNLCTISSLVRFTREGWWQADVSADVLMKNKFGFGLTYRFKDAVAGHLLFRLNEQFQLGYAYDYTLSDLGNYSGGSHEIMLRYDFGYTVHNTSPR